MPHHDALGTEAVMSNHRVVTREAASPPRYTVHQMPGVVQFGTQSREEAVLLARGFAREHAVDVWYKEGDACTALETYRCREHQTE
jgi:hypothetical protein